MAGQKACGVGLRPRTPANRGSLRTVARWGGAFWLIGCLVVVPLCAVAGSNADIQIVTRAEWGARPPRDDISTFEHYGLTRPEYVRIVLHVTSMGYGKGVAEMKRIQDYHMDARSFSDIGYNYLIDSEGTIFEGRPLNFVPSHAGRSIEGDERHDITLDPDYQSIGIVFSADTDQPLTDAQVVAAIRLIGYLKSRNPIESIITHTEVRQLLLSRRLTPQQEFEPERCPGAGSIEQIVRIRRTVDPAFDAAAYRALFGSGKAK